MVLDVAFSDVRVSVFIVGDAYQMSNTLMKGGCIEFRVHSPTHDGQ